MTIARPGRSSLRIPRALAILFVLALVLSGRSATPAAAASGLLGPPELGLRWETIPAVPCADRPITVLFTMCECTYDLVYAVKPPGRAPVVRVTGDPNRVCVTCTPDSAQVTFEGPFQAGLHVFSFDLETELVPDSLVTLSTWIEVPVAPSCSTGAIPYLERVVIGRPGPCLECPPVVCPDDSIDVFLAGTFPDDCTHLESVELIPSVVASPLPQPPMVRITYGTASCLGRPCVLYPQPWAARVRLPGLPATGEIIYRLPLEAYLHDHCTPDSIGTFLANASLPFTVADSCSTSVPPPPDRCANVAWIDYATIGDDPNFRRRCTAAWRAGGTTSLALAAGSQAPIAGVQGTFRFEFAGALRIVGVSAILPGWEVAHSFGPDGSERFIAFAGPGAAPIPGSIEGQPVPFMRVDVWHNDALDVVTPDVVYLAANDLLLSDPGGGGLRPCPMIATIYPPSTVAVLCREAPCDANADGRSDVRDLVVMVNCLNPPPNVRMACPHSTVLDCDRNGDFTLDDVFCCVRTMLGGGAPPDSGSTGGMRDAPEITARFGLPQAGPDGALEVPLYLGGMTGVAAARLDVAYPDARYELLDVTFDDIPQSWWTLHQEGGGRTRLAILDLGALGGDGPVTLGATGPTRATLRLRLREGATPGGELAVTAHDFAAGDGIGLSTPNAAPRLALAGAGSIALSAARPNPFTGSTAIALTLPTAGAIDVAVFAANGRRVATLLRESAAAAGVYDLAWDGRQDAGGRAPAGVYFVRVTGASADASRKVLFLPGGAR